MRKIPCFNFQLSWVFPFLLLWVQCHFAKARVMFQAERMAPVTPGPEGVRGEQSHRSKGPALLWCCHICQPRAQVPACPGHCPSWVTASLPEQAGRAFPHHQLRSQQTETEFVPRLGPGRARVRGTVQCFILLLGLCSRVTVLLKVQCGACPGQLRRLWLRGAVPAVSHCCPLAAALCPQRSPYPGRSWVETQIPTQPPAPLSAPPGAGALCRVLAPLSFLEKPLSSSNQLPGRIRSGLGQARQFLLGFWVINGSSLHPLAKHNG